MSDTKYTGSKSHYVSDDVALTDHAIHRWRQRTPHDCPVSLHRAWQLGEWLRHPEVVSSEYEQGVLSRARLYRHSSDWGVVFLVKRDLSEYGASEAVVTVINVSRSSHPPTEAYLEAHAIHGPGAKNDDD